jgi:hypothetical protein
MPRFLRHPLPHRRVGLIAAATLALVIAGCARTEDTPKLFETRRSIGSLGPGFIDATKPPAPESTIRPKPGSWDAVHPPRGYHVVLLTAGDDPATMTLITGVEQWAAAEDVRLETVTATEPDRILGAIVEEIDLGPDLVICAGNAPVDALALVTASHLKQQFLVVGAQLPEPTANVTAAIWRGASSRGTEVADTASSFDPESFTPRQVGAAIRAGVASVLNDISGIVISLD